MPYYLSLLLSSSLFCLLTIAPAARAEVNVVATIQPLALIARAVAGEAVSPRVLVDRQDSAHHFTLSPSDRLAVENADLILWVGPQFEVFLEPMMARLDNQSLLSALDLPDMALLNLDASTIDPHVWLDPVNAQVIASAVAAELARLDPRQADNYHANLAAFIERLEQLQSQISVELAALPDFSFAVYHNAYQYFEQRFGLNHGVALVDNPEIAPSIQQTLSVQARVREQAPACVLLEPDYSPALLATLMRDSAAEQLAVDLLGYDLSAVTNPDGTAEQAAAGYSQLLLDIASSFSRCAAAATQQG